MIIGITIEVVCSIFDGDKMWKELPIDTKSSVSQLKVITPKPEVSVDLPAIYKFESTRIISLADIRFYASVFEDQNYQVLDPSMAPIYDGLILRLTHNRKQIGLIVAIAHRIRLSSEISPKISPEIPDGISGVMSGLTTCLAIKPAYQSRGLAGDLIKLLMVRGLDDGVISGYFYGLKPKTLSAIPVRSWYRLIDVVEAHRLGYGITIPKVGSLDSIADQLEVAKRFFAITVTPSLSVRPTIWSDFETLTRRQIMLDLIEADFERFKLGSITWMTVVGPEHRMIFGVKPYRLVKPNQTTIPAGLLVYCETDGPITNPLEFKTYFDMILHTCREMGYVALHGVATGCLSFGVAEFLGPLLAIDSGLMFLDFYNLCTGRTRNPADVSLLYA